MPRQAPLEGGDVLKNGGVVSLLTASPSPSRGGDILKKGGIVSLLTASPSSSGGGDVPGGVRVPDEKSE